MERIKEALNKARNERNKNLGNVYLNNKQFNHADDLKMPGHIESPVKKRTLNNRLQNPIQYKETLRHKIESNYLQSKRIIIENDKTPAGKAYNLLRTKILHKLDENKWNSFAVVSANSGEGKTLTAINLAISIARDLNHTALLADFDLINPSIHSFFNYFPKYALVDYLLHDVSLNNVLMNPGIDGLLVLPGKNKITDSAETLASPVVASLANDLKEYYSSRIVIYDLPPLLEADDALSFSSSFDAVLIVVEDGVTTKNDLIRIQQILGDIPVLGTVLNKIPH